MNINHYDSALVNTNPYSEYNNIEDVIIEENYEEEPIEEIPSVESPIIDNNHPKKDKNIIDEEFEKEKNKILNERSIKMKNLRFVFIVFMGMIVISLAVLYNKSINRNEKVNIDPITVVFDDDSKIEEYLKQYYQKRDKSILESLLNNNKNNQDVINNINRLAYKQCYGFLEDIIASSTSIEDYTDKKNKLTSYIEGLNNISIDNVSILDKDKYITLNTMIETISDESVDYSTALYAYNNGDYNNAYNILLTISSNNAFYNQAQTYIERISKTIIDKLYQDIDNLEVDINNLPVAEQKTKYQEILNLINQYKETYSYLSLDSNSKIIELTDKYTALAN